MRDEISRLSREARVNQRFADKFLDCCLRRDSGIQAMKIIHDVQHVYETRRHALRRESGPLFHFHLTDVCLKESNFNVSAEFRRRPGIAPCPVQDMTVTLLHPYSPRFNITFRATAHKWLSLNCGDVLIFENIISSEGLDTFCVDGNIFLSHSSDALGSSTQRHEQRRYACHCGAQLSRSCKHVCRDKTFAEGPDLRS
jgi:hypothetical protein